MTRFSFGNSADYSTLFARDYNAQQAQQNALNVADQNAMDSDTYNQWQAGMISDQDWLNYIAGRVSATANLTDAAGVKTHEHWVVMGREYTNSISDNQAKSAYTQGGSINDYIAYLQNRIAGADPNNQATRALQTELATTLDTRSQQDLTSGAQAITDAIQTGTKTYSDLLKFYQQGLTSLRPDSALAKQVNTQIESTENQIKAQTISDAFGKLQYQYDSGQLSGSQIATLLRTYANKYYKNDATKYYTTLDTALKYDRLGGGVINQATGKSTTKAGGGGSGKSGSSTATYGTYSRLGYNTARDQQKASIDELQNIANQIKAGATAVTLTNLQGQPQSFPVNDALKAWVGEQFMRTSDALTQVYQNGNHGVLAQSAQKAKTAFITGTIQPWNTTSVAAQVGSMVLSAQKRIEIAQAGTDPQQVLNVAQQLASEFQTYGTHLTTQNVAAGAVPKRFGTDNGIPTVPTPQQDLPTAAALAEITGLTQFLTTVSQGGATRQDITDYLTKAASGKLVPASIVNEIADATVGPETQPGGKIVGAGPQLAALVSGNGIQVLAPPDPAKIVNGVPFAGGVVVVPTVPVLGTDGKTGIHFVVGQPDMSSVVAPGTDTKKTIWVWEAIDIGGKPTMIRTPANPYVALSTNLSDPTGTSVWNAWTATSAATVAGIKYIKGDAIPDTVIAAGKKDGTWQQMIAGGHITLQPANLGLYQAVIPAYTDSTGDTFVQHVMIYDPATHAQWDSTTRPVQFVTPSSRNDGSIAIGPDGTPMGPDGSTGVQFKPFATAGAMPFGYVGSHPQQAQQNWNNGAFQQQTGLQLRTRGADGSVSTAPTHTYDNSFFGSIGAVGPLNSGDSANMPTVPKIAGDNNWLGGTSPAAKIAQAREAWGNQMRASAVDKTNPALAGLSSLGDMATGAGLKMNLGTKTPTPAGPQLGPPLPMQNANSAPAVAPFSPPLPLITLPQSHFGFNPPPLPSVPTAPTITMAPPAPPPALASQSAKAAAAMSAAGVTPGSAPAPAPVSTTGGERAV